MKSPEQIIANHKQHAQREATALEGAIAAFNHEQAAFNLSGVFGAYLMQGLVSWRCAVSSPEPSFINAVDSLRSGLDRISTMEGTNASINDLPCATAAMLAFLINRMPIDFDLDALSSDSIVDGVIAKALVGPWNSPKWEFGINELKKIKGTALAVETYQTYQQLLQAIEVDQNLVNHATILFGKRKKDRFYSGGISTAGGGPYNDVTVDYILAAILKKIDYWGDCIHLWKWDEQS